jgi:hypothetical protein
VHGENTSSIFKLIVFPISHKYTETITQLHTPANFFQKKYISDFVSPLISEHNNIYKFLPNRIESKKIRKNVANQSQEDHQIIKKEEEIQSFGYDM